MTLLLTLDDGSVQRKLADAVEFARAAVLEDEPEEQLGAHVGVTREDAVTASHLFEAQVPGYGGWRWSVTVALAGDDEPVTVSEVVLVPGPAALVAPAWVPWERRVRAGDLGVGDIFPTDENDPRLAPAYLQSDDPAVEEVAREAGLGRVHVLSRIGRAEAAERWHGGEFGPRSDMARSAPDVCGTCGFFVPLAGSLRGVFGVCGNDIAPADGHVVAVEYGCGAHSEVEVEVTSSVPVAELVYDDSLLDYSPELDVVETAAAESETGIAESDVAPAEVEPEVAAEPESVALESVEVESVQGESAQAGAVAADSPQAEFVPGEQAGAVAAPVVSEAESAETVTEPVVEVAEATEPGEVAASVVTEPGEAAEAAEPDAPAGAEEVAEVSAAAEPAVSEVPEPAEAEPTQAEVTDATELPTPPEPSEPEMAEIPAAAESDAAEVDPLPAEAAESPVAEVLDSAEAERAEPQAAEVSGSAEAERAPAAEVAEPAEAEQPQAAEVPEAALTGDVVTAAESAETQEAGHTDVPDGDSAPQADEAQAQVDNAPER
ncbi:DUF3027 domain-containing protein [Amycolatopsis sp. NPDC026612]|uniref:DUF3027 domain-containing protein n=1 Tax=Amycolatopsis sp. NPDC026612 TaxID=3155466 RepID=UPI0033F79C23